MTLDDFYEGQADFHHLHTQLVELGLQYAGNLHQAYDRRVRKDGHVMWFDAVFVRSAT